MPTEVIRSSELLTKVFHFAKQKHAGQKRKDGKDYIIHPVAVSELVSETEEKIVALLHDVMEDTDTSTDEIINSLGVSKDVIEALKLMTHDDSISYEDYVKGLASNKLAKAVKLADLKHNLSTIDTLPEPKRTKLKTRYIWARDYLNGEENQLRIKN